MCHVIFIRERDIVLQEDLFRDVNCCLLRRFVCSAGENEGIGQSNFANNRSFYYK
jgi:hypothetical protein